MEKKVAFSAILILLAGLLPALNPSGAAAGKMEPALLERLAAEGRADFIVRFAERADLSPAFRMGWRERGWFVYNALRETAQRSQARAVAYLEGRGLAYESFFAGNTLYVRQGDLAAADFLAALPEVETVSAPRTYFIEPLIPSRPADAPQGLTWGIIDTHADQFWSTFGLQGEGIVVANIDTGVAYLHPALDQAYKCQADPGNPACWYDPQNICGGVPCDNVGHGTATMGVMVADDDPSLLYQAGMAPGAQWIACKACEYSCYEAHLLACADWILAPAGNPDNRPHVVDNAWGGAGCNSWFQGEVQAWVAAGIFPAFSPGGSGPSCGTIGSPADYQEVFAAGAHDSNRNIANFSARGPSCFGHDPYTKPNMSAPGVNICVPTPPDGWTCYSGTSFSGSFPPGAVALLWSCAPNLVGGVYPTFEALQNTADLPPPGTCGAPPDGEGNYTYGYGYLNILAAGQAYCAPAAPPEASFASDSPVCLGETMHFTDTSQASPPATEWFWSFGDGFTSTVQHPTHTYGVSGTFEVTLVVTNSEGSDQVTGTVVVHPLPEASFTYHPVSGPAPLTVYFTSTSQYAVTPTWSFGDGTYGVGEIVSHTYSLAGLYTATLTATSPYGCGEDTSSAQVEVYPTPYLTATFRAEPAEGCAPLEVAFTDESAGYPPIVSWLWTFGDGFTSTLQHPTHTYGVFGTFEVVLTVNNISFTASTTGTITVHPLPVASFAYRPTSGTVPLTVYFTSTSQYAVTPTWSFGDGTYGVGEIVSHTYSLAGLYTTTLTATSPYGCGEDTASAQVEVYPTPYLTATFRAEPAEGCAPLTVAFTDESAGYPPILFWFWAFGDGFTSTVQHPTHTYSVSGTFEVTLVVTNAEGSDQVTGTVVVHPLPVASFAYRPTSGTVPLTVYFTSTSQYAVTPTWSFGDGTYGVGEAVSHTYNQTGTYTVALTATSPYGCGEDTASAQVEVYLPAVCEPVDILTYTAQVSGCIATLGAEVSGDPPFEYLWDFGLFGAYTEANPEVNFQTTGTYTGALWVWNCAGQYSDTMALEVSVECAPPVHHYTIYLPLVLRNG